MFVIYDKKTTRYWPLKYGTHSYQRQQDAKAAMTRAANQYDDFDRDAYAIADADEFKQNIEVWVERKNLMSGKTFKEPINTPHYLSPASESYWSM